MSRREDRRSDSRRIHSRHDREPSPKRSRRDARSKAETERPHNELEPDKYRLERDDRQRRRLQDHGSKTELVTGSRESENRADGHHVGTKPSNDSTKVLSSRSYFQHNDRGDAGHNGRSGSRKIFNERGWLRDPKIHQNERTVNKTGTSDAHQKDDMSKDREKRNQYVHHEGYFKLEANPIPSMHRRPSFREQKVPDDPENPKKASAGPWMPNPEVHTIESDKRASRHSDKPERPFAAERGLNKPHSWRGNFSSWDRSGMGSRHYRGRERFNNPRQDYPPSGGRVEKWKHDLYNEANRSPTPKNEDDRISKIEALLA